jgi:hypothetical protein
LRTCPTGVVKYAVAILPVLPALLVPVIVRHTAVVPFRLLRRERYRQSGLRAGAPCTVLRNCRSTPRTSDGKPDLSGLWQAANNLPCDGINRVCTDLPVSPQFFDIGVDLKQGLPYQHWARERMKNRRMKRKMKEQMSSNSATAG